MKTINQKRIVWKSRLLAPPGPSSLVLPILAHRDGGREAIGQIDAATSCYRWATESLSGSVTKVEMVTPMALSDRWVLAHFW